MKPLLKVCIVECGKRVDDGSGYYVYAHNFRMLCLSSAANVVLERSIERIIVGDLFCDLPLGLYVIRGENVVLIGELVSCLYIYSSCCDDRVSHRVHGDP